MIEFNLKGNWKTKEIWLNKKPLSPSFSQQYVNHSPDGFNWGYAGSGPAQLALAIWIELWPCGINGYQDFKRDFIAELPQSDFDVTLAINFKLYEERQIR